MVHSFPRFYSPILVIALTGIFQAHAFQTSSTIHLPSVAFSKSISSQTVTPLTFPSPEINTIHSILHASTASDADTTVDFSAVSKYVISGAIEMSLMSLTLIGVDYLQNAVSLPQPFTWLLFYAFSLKSRIFNPLNNARPDRGDAIDGKESKGFKDRIMPKWTPPGITFPIMWLLIIAPLRATSSMFIVNDLGSHFNPTVLCLMLHLTIGDIWNTINNAESRYGASATGVLAVYASAIYAATQYYSVNNLAGGLLGATCIWLTIASGLIVQTWRLNVGDDGSKDSLLPTRVKGKDSITKFSWF